MSLNMHQGFIGSVKASANKRKCDKKVMRKETSAYEEKEFNIDG